MTEKERNKKAREFRRLWKYSQHLKEGGRAWERVIQRMEQIKAEIYPN